MLDTTLVATEIRNHITAGATERALMVVVSYLAGQFPDMTSAELSAAMQEAMAAAEKRALRRALVKPARSKR